MIFCVFRFVSAISRKKSVDDLLTSSQDVIDQPISLSTSAAKQSKAKRSPSPKKSHKRDKSDVSTFSSENVEVVSDSNYVIY